MRFGFIGLCLCLYFLRVCLRLVKCLVPLFVQFRRDPVWCFFASLHKDLIRSKVSIEASNRRGSFDIAASERSVRMFVLILSLLE